jgi:hypothetical protein
MLIQPPCPFPSSSFSTHTTSTSTSTPYLPLARDFGGLFRRLFFIEKGFEKALESAIDTAICFSTVAPGT